MKLEIHYGYRGVTEKKSCNIEALPWIHSSSEKIVDMLFNHSSHFKFKWIVIPVEERKFCFVGSNILFSTKCSRVVSIGADINSQREMSEK